ncbi:MAG TPA: LCP family protein [Anaerolineales bacterium]
MRFLHRKPSHSTRPVCLLIRCVLLLSFVSGCGGLNQAPAPTAPVTASLTPTLTLTPTPTRTLTPIPTKRPALCGGPRVMFILLVGSDARRDTYSIGLADSVRIVRMDFVDATVRVLAFPRDLYVKIPGIEDHNGITRGKLNQAYLYGNPGYNFYEGPGQGPGLLALTLEHNFGAHVDHYVAVNLQTFVKIIDTLGGIDIDLPYEVDGRVKGSRDRDRVFAAGEHHLDGYRTMLLARLRPDGDFRRAEVQSLILKAVAEKALSQDIILKLPELIQDLSDSVQTDLGPVEITQLLCLRTRLNPQDIEFLSFPERLFTNERVRDPVLGNTSIVDADFEILKGYVQRFNDGSWHWPEEPAREKTVP